MNKVAGFFVVLLAVVVGLVVLYPGAYVCAPPHSFQQLFGERKFLPFAAISLLFRRRALMDATKQFVKHNFGR
jgi:hypothetical protein